MIKQALALIALTLSLGANADVIDFEDLTATDGNLIPQGYNGFSWGGEFGVSSWVNNAGAPLNSNPPALSGTNYAWSNGGARLELSDGSFNIESLGIASTQGETPTPTVTFEGLLNGVIIFTDSVVASSTWVIANLNFTGIDLLRFDGDINTNLMVDDITFSRTNVVPIPAAAWLFGSALLGLGVIKRKRA